MNVAVAVAVVCSCVRETLSTKAAAEWVPSFVWYSGP